MKYSPFFPLRTRSLLAAIALTAATAALAPIAHADATPDNWWVYIHNDKASEVKTLLAKGADPNVRYKNGQPALMRAVVDGAWEVFDVLAADPRTDVNAVNPANETALMYLAVAGETDRARSLIKRGAQVNRLGWTPLHYAASKAQMDVAKLLLANKAMVNAPSPEGTTPIMMAGFSGRKYMVDLLLDAGADITTRNLKGQNASDWAYVAKRGELGAELAQIIAKAEQQRDIQRGKSGSAKAAPASQAPRQPQATPVQPQEIPQAVQSSPTAPKSADAPTPSGDGGADLGGVSGVKLNSYD
ncbi:ankyrin repeat domain-containing protein [Bordetella tumulicola]|uniref:ankyrin repeat domain-containing protein n=1 Tax=Bordetella tumulicola TaxID=1649133 RepID=UPI0039F0F2A8